MAPGLTIPAIVYPLPRVPNDVPTHSERRMLPRFLRESQLVPARSDGSPGNSILALLESLVPLPAESFAARNFFRHSCRRARAHHFTRRTAPSAALAFQRR